MGVGDSFFASRALTLDWLWPVAVLYVTVIGESLSKTVSGITIVSLNGPTGVPGVPPVGSPDKVIIISTSPLPALAVAVTPSGRPVIQPAVRISTLLIAPSTVVPVSEMVKVVVGIAVPYVQLRGALGVRVAETSGGGAASGRIETLAKLSKAVLTAPPSDSTFTIPGSPVALSYRIALPVMVKPLVLQYKA